jgi:hypothetical protein
MKATVKRLGSLRSATKVTLAGRSTAGTNQLRIARDLNHTPSSDWTKLSNILRRSGGGFSHSRTRPE